MAARNPTTYTLDYDESALVSGRPITESVPSTVLDNQQFVLDQANVVLHWQSRWYLQVTTYSNSWKWLARLWCHFDMCGVSDTHDVYASFKVMNLGSTATDRYEVGCRFNNVSGGPNTLSTYVNYTAALAEWTPVCGPIAMRSDGEEEILFGINPDPDGDGTGVGMLPCLLGAVIYSAER